MQSGYLAVDFFFMLSGLVVAGAYSARLNSGTLSILEFTKTRAIRLYPMYLMGTLIGGFVALGQTLASRPHAWGVSDLVWVFGVAILFIPAPGSYSELFPLNPPAWSLLFELAINVAFASVLKNARPKVLFTIAAISACALVVTALTTGHLSSGMRWSSVGGGGARITFSFTIGVIFARMELQMRKSGWSFLILLTLLGVLLNFQTSDGKLRVAYDLAVVLLVFPALIYCCSAVEPPKWANRYCGFLGAISYPIYAVHYPFLLCALPLLRRSGIPESWWLPLLVISILYISYVVTRWIDGPVRDRLSKRFLPSKLRGH